MLDSFVNLTNWTLESALKKINKSDVKTVVKYGPYLSPHGGLVHEALINEGIIEDPLISENCFRSEWIEEFDWLYETYFDLPSSEPDSLTELWFESLDGIAQVYLNGKQIAQHNNSYRPLSVNISESVQKKRNHLQVRMSLGLEAYNLEDSTNPDGVRFATEESLGYRNHRGEVRRIFLRKPSYGFGWDWSPRVCTLGFAGEVRLRTSRSARIESLATQTLQLNDNADQAEIEISVELSGLHYYSSTAGHLSVKVIAPNGETVELNSRHISITSGYNEEKFRFTIQAPELWWPRGQGAQPLYIIYAQLCDNNRQELSAQSREMGIRTLRLLRVGTFAFEVNGRKVFCQGGNWVPPDAIYTRANEDRYKSLIESAAAANMNMLRVWGGGRYERDYFYHTCDRLGLLVWQDFMFSCAPYPDHLLWFRNEVEAEARYQIRRLSSHACLALWCGSNENTWAMCDWWHDQTRRGAHIYNEILPRAVRDIAPQTPYWIGSPYGGKTPNETGCGNNHFWKEPGGMMCSEQSLRIDLSGHDRFHSFFISEYGYHGPCSLEETQRYLGTKNFDRNSSNWIHHTNTRKYESTLQAAVEQVYEVTLTETTNEDYLLYGGLWQGIAYAYSLDSAHFRDECSGVIIWMLNEAWGEAGWGIIDNSLNHKISWYFVRRALAPERLILRSNQTKGTAELMLYSSTGNPLPYQAELRLNTPDGNSQVVSQPRGKISSERQIIGNTPIEAIKDKGYFISAHAKVGERSLDSVILWPGNYSSMLMLSTPSKESIKIQVSADSDKAVSICIKVESLVHAVHLSLDGKLLCQCDQYFDIFPEYPCRISLNLPIETAIQISISWIGLGCISHKHSINELLNNT